jgi:hypothetical protein
LAIVDGDAAKRRIGGSGAPSCGGHGGVARVSVLGSGGGSARVVEGVWCSGARPFIGHGDPRVTCSMD